MAGKTLVRVNRAKIKRFLEEVKDEKGDFSLAMLAQTLPEVQDRWTLVVSAPWADSVGSRSAISYLSSRLSHDLDRYSLAAIDRISVRPTDDPIVQTIIRDIVQECRNLGKDVSSEEHGHHLRNSSVRMEAGENWEFGEGFVFFADPDAKNGRPRENLTHMRRATR